MLTDNLLVSLSLTGILEICLNRLACGLVLDLDLLQQRHLHRYATTRRKIQIMIIDARLVS